MVGKLTFVGDREMRPQDYDPVIFLWRKIVKANADKIPHKIWQPGNTFLGWWGVH
jgi:hypothetical protein